MKRLLWLVAVLALVFALLPVLRYQSTFDVEVTWSIKQKRPLDRELVFDGETFTIPAGEKVVRRCRLVGGGDRALFWDCSGFGLGFDPVKIVGYDHRGLGLSIRTLSESGTWRVFGLGSKRTKEVQIELFD